MAEKITITVEKKENNMEFVKTWITSDFDYLDAIHTRSMSFIRNTLKRTFFKRFGRLGLVRFNSHRIE